MDKSSMDPGLTELLKTTTKVRGHGPGFILLSGRAAACDYLTYWDYIHLDTLLSLQNPKTVSR